MTETRQTLHDAVDQAMKYEVWVKPGEFRSEDVYYVAEVGQVSPDYDSADEAQKACHALNIDAAIAAILDRLRDLPDDALHAGIKAWRGTIAFGDRSKLVGETGVVGFNALDAMRASILAIADAFEKERGDDQ